MQLPQPDQDAKAHSQKLQQHIIAKINCDGPLSFADYMDLALYAPGLGYYSAGAQKFGREGDFVTAPEISPLFAQCLAAHMLPLLTSLAQPIIMELGAGSGCLAVDLLTRLAALNQLPEAYYILEVSADLRQRQQTLLAETCPDYFNNIHWLDTLPPDPFNGIIFGNEVIDAMPVHCFEVNPQGRFERVVAVDGNEFTWGLAPLPEKLHKSIDLLPVLGENYQSELNLGLQPWLSALNACLKSGEILFIDYGFSEREYYHPSRCTGTLMCHYRHQAHTNPFFYPGLQDITSHVDFTALAIAADALGLDVMGYNNQAAFLMDCGIAQLAEQQPPLTASKAIQTLTFPHEMGELFKVFSARKQCEIAAPGFTDDLLERL